MEPGSRHPGPVPKQAEPGPGIHGFVRDFPGAILSDWNVLLYLENTYFSFKTKLKHHICHDTFPEQMKRELPLISCLSFLSLTAHATFFSVSGLHVSFPPETVSPSQRPGLRSSYSPLYPEGLTPCLHIVGAAWLCLMDPNY